MEDKNTFKIRFKRRCFDFSLNIIRLCSELQEKKINRTLCDQLIRSATSIGANIVEGGNSVSKKEFINYFQIALKSSAETAYWLALLKEINLDQKDKIEELLNESVELKKLIIRIILNTKSNSKF